MMVNDYILMVNDYIMMVNDGSLSGCWLTYPSEKWWSSSVGIIKFMNPNIWKKKKMFQTTNQEVMFNGTPKLGSPLSGMAPWATATPSFNFALPWNTVAPQKKTKTQSFRSQQYPWPMAVQESGGLKSPVVCLRIVNRVWQCWFG